MLSAVSLSKCQSLGIEIIRNNFTESLQHTYQDVSEGRVYPAANDIWSYNNSHYNFLSTSTVTKKKNSKRKKKAEVLQWALPFHFTESQWVPSCTS